MYLLVTRTHILYTFEIGVYVYPPLYKYKPIYTPITYIHISLLHTYTYTHTHTLTNLFFNRLGWTPFHHAAAHGHIEALEYLWRNFQSSISLTQRDSAHCSPCFLAAHEDYQEAFQYLLSIGSSPEDKNEEDIFLIELVSHNEGILVVLMCFGVLVYLNVKVVYLKYFKVSFIHRN